MSRYKYIRFNSYRMVFIKPSSLHYQCVTGDLKRVQKKLSQPGLDVSRTKKIGEIKNKFGLHMQSCTILHCALLLNKPDRQDSEFLNKKFNIAKMILQKDCSQIINYVNAMRFSSLSLICDWPNHEQAIELAHLAFSNGASIKSADLAALIRNDNIALIQLLINKDVNFNEYIGENNNETVFEYLFSTLTPGDDTAFTKLNQLLILFLDNGADPNISGITGKNLSDLILEYQVIDSLSDETLDKITSHITNDQDIKKRKKIFKKTHNLISPYSNNFLVFAHNRCTLATEKRERRKKLGGDFDCTTLRTLQQLEEYLTLTELRINERQYPFYSQFIVQANEYNIHASTGQILVDKNGGVTFFWADTAGHSPETPDFISDATADVGNMVKNHFPEATLYTVGEMIQNTRTGCSVFALYIAKQLSVACNKTNNSTIQNDLHKAWYDSGSQSPIEYKGFRVIAFDHCPAYTGIPRIVQSLSKPDNRIKRNKEQDEIVLNNKQQNYRQAIDAQRKCHNGILINNLFNHKRIQDGNILKDILSSYSHEEITNKQLSSVIDIKNRVSQASIQQGSVVEITKNENDDQWEIYISLPALRHQCYLVIKANDPDDLLEGIKQQRQDLYYDKHASTFITDFSLFNYIAIDILIEEMQSERFESNQDITISTPI